MFNVTLNSEFAGVLKEKNFKVEQEAYDYMYDLEVEADILTAKSILNGQEDYHFVDMEEL